MNSLQTIFPSPLSCQPASSRVRGFLLHLAQCPLPNAARPNARQVSGFEHVFEGMDVLVDNMLGGDRQVRWQGPGLRDCRHGRTEYKHARHALGLQRRGERAVLCAGEQTSCMQADHKFSGQRPQ